MSPRKVFHAVTDDTALVANVSEIKKWATQGVLSLTVPIYTIERLHVLKRDASQIGINAREAVKFLDRITSGKEKISEDTIQLQGPDEQYKTWKEVEKQLADEREVTVGVDVTPTGEKPKDDLQSAKGESRLKKPANPPQTADALSQALLEKLNFAKESEVASAASTPPTSPALSNLQSSKSSPEVSNVHLAKEEATEESNDVPSSLIVPHTYRPLINAMVFLMNKLAKESSPLREVFVLTNDNDMTDITRKFGLNIKNIHQLRAAISTENQEMKNQTRYQKKHSPKPSLTGASEPKPRTLFSYEDDGDDDEIVFRPRGGRNVVTSRGRGNNTRGHNDHRHSAEASTLVPEVPVHEIDPDSFDRGAFSRPRPSTAGSSTTANGHQSRSGRGGGRGPQSPQIATRGSPRGHQRGSDRGSTRGKGKLFIP